MPDKARRNILDYLGPGIITAALIFGPGSLTITSKLGASYHYNLLWLIILSTGFMILFTVMSARFGLASRRSFLQTIRRRYGRGYAIFLGFCLALVAISFQTGNAIGAGLAAGGLVNTAPVYWILLFSLAAILLLFLRSFYKILEKIMIIMVLVMIFSFLITLLISRPDPAKLLQGFIPVIPSGSELLSIALIASSFSLAGAFFQSYLVQEKQWKLDDKDICIREGIAGIIILGFISAVVMMTAASVLYTSQVDIKNAADMGRVLEPLFGSMAYVVFMIGLFAASFSSLIGNATLGGILLADALSIDIQLHNRGVRLLIMIIVGMGALMAVIFRELGIQLIIIAQGLTILLAPLLGLIIFLFTAREDIMGRLTNSIPVKILAIAALCLLLFLAGGYLYLMFF